MTARCNIETVLWYILSLTNTLGVIIFVTKTKRILFIDIVSLSDFCNEGENAEVINYLAPLVLSTYVYGMRLHTPSLHKNRCEYSK